MTVIRVLEAVRLGDQLRATVELDGLVTVTNVAVQESPYTGRMTAVPPKRPYGDGRSVLSWSPSVATQVVTAILEALPDSTVAVSEGEAA